MQNKLLKLLLQLDRLTPTNILHKNLNILKINDLYKCSILSFINDTQIGKCPRIFEKYFHKKHSHYDLRQKGKLDIPPARLTLGDRAVSIKGAKLWNDIHKDLIPYKCKISLKRHLMKWHVSRYNPWQNDWTNVIKFVGLKWFLETTTRVPVCHLLRAGPGSRATKL